MYRDLLVNHEKVVKFLNFIYDGKIKLWVKFSGICQVNPIIYAGWACCSVTLAHAT